MATTIAKSRKATKTAKVEKHVLVLARYFIKATGSVVYHVRNGENKEYCVSIHTNGTTGCIHYGSDESCEALRHGKKCYHIKECLLLENARKAAPHFNSFFAAVAVMAFESVLTEDTEIVMPEDEAEADRQREAIFAARDAYNAYVRAEGKEYLVIVAEEPTTDEIPVVRAEEEEIDWDVEYAAWKAEHGLNRPMSEEEVVEAARELAYLDC